jgi:hypothetical protein
MMHPSCTCCCTCCCTKAWNKAVQQLLLLPRTLRLRLLLLLLCMP